uniref:Uncharacterized protein n=1 Tax=Esox lucius TaxID=8010 RepID=A0A6Q2Z493_ESOLU
MQNTKRYRNITNSMPLSTKSCHQNLIVFLLRKDLKKVVTVKTIIRNKSCNLLAVFDQLHPHTFSDGRVGLLSFNTPKEKENNALSVRSPSERVGLQGSAQVGFLVLLVMPPLLPAVVTQFSGCTQTSAFTCGNSKWTV